MELFEEVIDEYESWGSYRRNLALKFGAEISWGFTGHCQEEPTHRAIVEGTPSQTVTSKRSQLAPRDK